MRGLALHTPNMDPIFLLALEMIATPGSTGPLLRELGLKEDKEDRILIVQDPLGQTRASRVLRHSVLTSSLFRHCVVWKSSKLDHSMDCS